MPNQIFAFSVPKIGETEKNIQDRFDSSPDDSLIAISDGAGSSLYPRKWAEILVKSFCSSVDKPIDKLRNSHEEWLKPAQEEWRQYYLEKLANPNRNWWEGGSQIKDRGSATFLGLSLPCEESKWEAVAVGDSCLFKLAKNTDNLISFPINDSQEFKSTTQCWSSLPEYASFSPQFANGFYQEGDIFLLATDALSQWILKNYESESSQWKKIFQIEQNEEFVLIIEELRQKNLIKNDDTTAILIK